MTNLSHRSKLAQAVRICRLFFEDGQTQSAIALAESISTATVSRILAESRQKGFVRIRVTPQIEVELAEGLKSKFIDLGIHEIIVGGASSADTGALAAQFFECELEKIRLGVPVWKARPVSIVLDGGMTIKYFVDAVLGDFTQQLQIFPICTDPPSYEVSSYELMTRLSTKCRSTCEKLPYSLAETSALTEIHKRVSNEARGADFVFLGVGPWRPGFTALDLVVHLGVEPFQLQAKYRNVCAVVGYCPISHAGEYQHVPELCDQMRRSLEFADIQRCAQDPASCRVVLVSGDVRKLEAVNAAILAGICNTLIVDTVTAERLLDS